VGQLSLAHLGLHPAHRLLCLLARNPECDRDPIRQRTEVFSRQSDSLFAVTNRISRILIESAGSQFRGLGIEVRLRVAKDVSSASQLRITERRRCRSRSIVCTFSPGDSD